MFILVKLCKNVDHLIDVTHLKLMYEPGGRLEGARVFARLFGILEDGLFQTSEQSVVDLSPYDIYESEWLLLYGFIRNGFISRNKYNSVELCYEVSLKQGGIPSLETYLDKEFIPLTPLEDFKQKYQWSIRQIPLALNEVDTSVTVPCNDGNYVYTRKMKHP